MIRLEKVIEKKQKDGNVFRGDRLKELRTARGLTAKQLANLIQGKQQQISDYENKNRYPHVATLIRIVKVLGCSTDYLLDLSDKPTEQITGLRGNLALLLSTLPQDELDKIERVVKAMLPPDGG